MLERSDFEGRIALLSDKHMTVLQRIALHKSSKTIARELGISQFTVDQRAKRIMQILGVHSRKEAATLFLLVEEAIQPSTRLARFDWTRSTIDLTIFQKSVLIFAFMLSSIILLAVLVLVAEGLSRIY